jgi:hypothetical protein
LSAWVSSVGNEDDEDILAIFVIKGGREFLTPEGK